MSTQSNPTAKPGILVVEADMAIGNHLADQLRGLGYHVIDVVSTGENAVRAAQDSATQLVLMDIEIKGDLDGIEAARQIRATRGVPAILLAANEVREIGERAKASEPFGFLVKPYGTTELNRSIELALYKAEMERRLLASEARYRDMAELSPLFVYEIDAEGRFVYANSSGKKMAGYAQGEALPPLWDVFAEESIHRLSVNVSKILAGEKTSGNEYELIRKDGSKVPILAYSSPVVRENRVVGLRGTAFDLSDRKRMEGELAASEERFRTISECLPDAILVVQDRKIVKSNPAVNHVLGYREEELEGITFSAIWPPNTELQREKILERLHVHGSVFDGVKLRRKDGSSVLTDVTSATIPWDNDSAVLVTLRDATARIAALEALRRAKEEWELTFHSVPDLIAIIGSDYRIKKLNRAMAERLGLGLDEAVGMPCHEVVHGTAAPFCSCPHSALLHDGATHGVEVVEQRLGGTFFVTASPLLGSNGRVLGCVHVARDITEQKLAQDRQRDLMDEVKAFTYLISHDLRVLMNIMGFPRAQRRSEYCHTCSPPRHGAPRSGRAERGLRSPGRTPSGIVTLCGIFRIPNGSYDQRHNGSRRNGSPRASL